MSRKIKTTLPHDLVWEDSQDGFFYCRVAGQKFGPWRFRGEAVAGMASEKRRHKERALREANKAEMTEAAHGAVNRQLTVTERTIAERDKFRARFVTLLGSATLEDLEIQYERITEDFPNATTPAEEVELVNGHTLVEAVMVYRFGKQPRARECRKLSRIMTDRKKYEVKG